MDSPLSVSVPTVFTRTVLGLFLLGIGLVGSAAPVSSYGQITGTGAFSRLGFGARGMSLGNALVADNSSTVSPHYNPALLPSTTQQRVSISGALLAFDRELQFLEFTAPLGPSAGIGLSFIHGGVNDIDGRNEDGYRTETLSTDEYALSLSFGNRFADWLSVGTAITVYQSKIVPDADPVRSLGVNLGVGAQVTERLYVAGSVRDLLAKYEWNTSSSGGGSHTDRFPVRLDLGASYSLYGGQLRLLGEVESRFTARERRVREYRVTSGGPQEETRTESFLFHQWRGRLGISYQAIEILEVRTGVDRIGLGGVGGLRPSAGFGVRQSVGNLDLRLSYTATLEPYVRTLMNTATLELFLSEE